MRACGAPTTFDALVARCWGGLLLLAALTACSGGGPGLVTSSSSSSGTSVASTSGNSATASGGNGTAGTATSGGSTSTSGGTGEGSTGSASGLSTAGSFPVNTEAAFELSPLQGNPVGDLALNIADFVFGPFTCDYLTDPNGGPSGVEVAIHVYERDPATPVGVGTYAIVPYSEADAGTATLTRGSLYGNGAINGELMGASGEITLTRVDRGSVVHGSFTSVMQIIWDGGIYGTLTDEFDAMWCGPTQ